jgi:hypothetical protein
MFQAIANVLGEIRRRMGSRMIDDKLIHKAAGLLVEKYGPEAATKANERFHLLTAEGFREAADLWMEVTKAVCAMLRTSQQGSGS